MMTGTVYVVKVGDRYAKFEGYSTIREVDNVCHATHYQKPDTARKKICRQLFWNRAGAKRTGSDVVAMGTLSVVEVKLKATVGRTVMR